MDNVQKYSTSITDIYRITQFTLHTYLVVTRAGIAQPIWRLAMSWTTKVSEFESRLGARIFTSPCRTKKLWGLPSLLSNGYQRLFPRGYGGQGVKLTTHLQLVPSSRKLGSVHPLPHMFHGVVLN
jgi:hypothetical protein